MTEEVLCRDVAIVVGKQFGLDIPEDAIAGDGRWEQLHAWLRARILALLDGRLEHLLHILYRIDIGEEQSSEALRIPSAMESADALARMIIERQKQKIITRHLYRASREQSGAESA